MKTLNSFQKSIAIIAIATVVLLLIPLIAMQFTNELIWEISDFIIAGGLLFGTGLTFLVLTKRKTSVSYRFAIFFALFTGLLLIWVNGAVGLIGSENQSANMMYFGVLAIGLIGAFISRFNSKGMYYTMFFMAVGIVLIATIALISGMQHYSGSSVGEILGVNAFFMVLFIISGILFLNSSNNESVLSTE